MSSQGSVSASVNLIKERAALITLEIAEDIAKGLSLKPRPSDVMIVTPPKCGTTWMQQIVHQLRTGGDMTFYEISEVVPSIELAYAMHVDLEAEQTKNPRCYKTHCGYEECPKGPGKYIVIYREPCAAAYSFFKFFEGWFFESGDVAVDEFARDYWLALGRAGPGNEAGATSYFEHLVSWWKHRNDQNVLFLFFEEMKEDLESVVRAVASFIGIKNEENIKTAVKMSCFDFMKANHEKFQEKLFLKVCNKACGLSDDPSVAEKVVTGSTTKALEVMSDETKEVIQKRWEDVVTKETGYQTYDELRRAFRRETPLVY